MGHMNVMWYVGKFDQATWQLLGVLGLTATVMRTRGTGMVAVEQTLNYLKELVAGSTLSIYSSVLDVKDKSLKFRHEMRNDETGEIAATAILVGVHFDTKVRKACPIPEDLRDRARAMIGG
jgi:acyl-CoA thioester hydrolase